MAGGDHLRLETTRLNGSTHAISVGMLVLSLVLGIVALVLGTASPALADTGPATWPFQTPPAGAVGVPNNSLVQAMAFDPAGFPVLSVPATMTINGAQVSAGAFTVFRLDANDVLLSFDPALDGLLASGPNTVDVSVTDALGAVSTHSWSFSVYQPAAITGFTPPAASFVTTSHPTITVTLANPDNHALVGQFAGSSPLRINGFPVSCAPVWAAGTTTYSYYVAVLPPIGSPSTPTVEFSVADSGITIATTWSFVVNTSPDITPPTLSNPTPIPNSTTDRRPIFSITATDDRPGNLTVSFVLDGSTPSGFPRSAAQGATSWTPVSNLSLGSHVVTATAADTAGNSAAYAWSFEVTDTLTAQHATSTGFTQCSGCHNPNLIPEHEGRGLTCDTCHTSADETVQDAIADNNTACGACHDAVAMASGHASLHDRGLPSGGGCTECHMSNISAEHEDNCATCHDSTDDRVAAAIAGSNVKCGACHSPGVHAPGFFGFRQDYYQWTTTPGPWGRGTPLGDIGDNPANPGAHANYLPTTAKCGMCHSVHRAAGDGTKLLPTEDATCAGCHAGGTSVTAKLVTWSALNPNWVPSFDASGNLTNGADAGGGGGPHNDSAATLIEDGYWNGTDPLPRAGFDAAAGELRYGCFTRRCHATNPHGANSSKYKIFAAKLLFNEPANDDEFGDGTYGGDDAIYDAMGATDASVERFVANNSSIVQTTVAGDILVKKAGDAAFRALDANETHDLVAGLTCGRPSNPSTGEDECHAEASYAIVEKGIKENRNHGTGLTAAPKGTEGRTAEYTTDNVGDELEGWGGNDSRTSKTGHVAGTFAAVPANGSYAPVAGCTSCHDQTDSANTVEGNFTFPHGQTASGASNLTSDGLLPATGLRSRLWAGYAGATGATLTITAGTPQKAYDGQCLKCHRDAGGAVGIGKTK